MDKKGLKITSQATPHYNCIAYAAGDENNWWQPPRPYPIGRVVYWPPSFPPDMTWDTLKGIFSSLGYTECESGAYEPGFEKVALYGTADQVKHAAKQLPTGKWSSKLGMGHDVTHQSSRCVAGEGYGTIISYMKRSRSAK